MSDLDSMVMTNDEFCTAGIDNAELAASPDIELEQASSYLRREQFTALIRHRARSLWPRQTRTLIAFNFEPSMHR